MKKGLIVFAAVALLIGGCTSQRPTTTKRYDRYDQRDNQYGRYDNQNVREIPLENKLNRWQNELRLTNRQKREIRTIQERYERQGLSRNGRNNRYNSRELQQQKQKDLLSVLTRSQRERLFQLEQQYRRS